MADEHKFSAVRHPSRPVEKRNFYLPYTVPACDGRKDGRTDGWARDDTKYLASMASRGKKRSLFLDHSTSSECYVAQTSDDSWNTEK